MASSTKQLYLFLTACSGNWRNTVHISCQGVQIDPAECCGQLTEAGFEALYGKYLLWQCPSAEGHSLKQLCEGAVNI